MKNKEQEERKWYKTILEMDLYHYANSEPEVDWEDREENRDFKRKRILSEIKDINDINCVVDAIEEYSSDLDVHKKRCILCSEIVVGNPYKIASCNCNFINYDHNFDFPECSRYVIDLKRLENNQ